MRLLPRVIGSALVLAAPVAVLIVVLYAWVAPVGPNRSAAPGLGELPVELWPLIVALPVICWAVGLTLIWRRG